MAFNWLTKVILVCHGFVFNNTTSRYVASWKKKNFRTPLPSKTNRDLASVPRKHRNLSGRFGHDHSKIDTVSWKAEVSQNITTLRVKHFLSQRHVKNNNASCLNKWLFGTEMFSGSSRLAPDRRSYTFPLLTPFTCICFNFWLVH